LLYKGEPTGTLTEDNARVILEQAERVSNAALSSAVVSHNHPLSALSCASHLIFRFK
jgi:ABC-type lipoprotein export system ATPase subunit